MSSIYTNTGQTKKDHVHRLVREDLIDHGERYRYRCVKCNARLKALSGMLVRGEKPQ